MKALHAHAQIAPGQLTDLGVHWVILGHSERRSLLDESNEFVGEKTANALRHGMKGHCMHWRDATAAGVRRGETAHASALWGLLQAGPSSQLPVLTLAMPAQMYDVLDAQLRGISDHVDDWDRVVLAYEPVWAIGTGKVRHVHAQQLLPGVVLEGALLILADNACTGGHAGAGAGGACVHQEMGVRACQPAGGWRDADNLW